MKRLRLGGRGRGCPWGVTATRGSIRYYERGNVPGIGSVYTYGVPSMSTRDL